MGDGEVEDARMSHQATRTTGGADRTGPGAFAAIATEAWDYVGDGHSHAAPRTPEESPCRLRTIGVSTKSENT